MTSSWPDRVALDTPVLRGSAAGAIPAARLDSDLRSNRFVRTVDGVTRVDARLVDPGLEAAFEEVADGVRLAAQAQGFAAGWAQGQAAATAEVREQAAAARTARQAEDREHRRRVVQALGTLAAAADALEARAVVPAEQVREELLTGALALVETLVGHELAVATTPGLDAVRRALDLSPHGATVTIALNPQDRTTVAGLVEDGHDFGRAVVLVADPSLSRGDALVDCDATRVDARLSAALDRVRAVLVP